MPFEVRDKTVLVTGANRGIGRSIVEEALARGAVKVYAAVRKLEAANELVGQFGERVVPIQIDLNDPASISSAAEKTGDVDVVINNAGVLRTASAVAESAIEALQFEMEVNVFGLIRMAQAFAATLKANGGGAFVQLNSVVSVKSFPEFATYCASKAASYSLTQSLRESLRDQETLVVSVHPGPIQTDMASAAGLGEIAEPPSLVAKAIFDAIASGTFHVWPDSMAKQIGAAYQSFAESVIESNMSEAPV